jgi:3-dehydro-4-phosphotetronate decarboxylase
MPIPVLSETEARHEICRVGKSLFDRGYVHATAGNISVRLDDSAGGGFLITPTDACLGFLDPRGLARLDIQGRQISGDPASKTFILHQSIYQEACKSAPQTACIIHTHSTHCVALSLQASALGELIPAITPYFVMKVGHVPHIAYQRPGSKAAADATVAVIARFAQQGISLRAVMLERLGPNVWHHNPASAMAVLEELEETAKLYYLSERRQKPLSADQIDELRQTFGVHW